MIPVRETVAQLIGTSIKPLARSAGFKKVGFNFYRRRGDLIQVVNIQLSQYNYLDVGGFFVNIGIAFDQLRELEGRSIEPNPREYSCHFRRRIRDFCPNAPDMWGIDANINLLHLNDTLTVGFQRVLSELDPIASIPSFLSRNLLRGGSEYGILARLQYVSGNMDEAWQALQTEAACFVDRRGMSLQNLVDRYHLEQLRGRLP
jgi:hypothetical protein